MVRTPEEIHQSLIEVLSDLRRSTEENRDKISKLIETMGDKSNPEAERLHRQLSNSVGILNKTMDELTSHEDSASAD